MGIDAKCLVFLSKVNRSRPLGRCVTFGRQHLFIEQHLLAWASANSGIPEHILDRENGRYADQLLGDHFGVTELVSIDVFDSDKPTVLHDLNNKIPESMVGYFDSVLDIGTSEHIFSTKSVFENAESLCKEDGFIVHYVPGNNMCGHGLYQFSPTLFQSVYGNEIQTGTASVYVNFQSHETKFYKIKFVPQDRINIHFGGLMTIFVFVAKEKLKLCSKNVQQMDYKMSGGGREVSLLEKTNTFSRSRFFQILKRIRQLRILVSYIRSWRFYSYVLGWLSFRRYSVLVHLADETF